MSKSVKLSNALIKRLIHEEKAKIEIAKKKNINEAKKVKQCVKLLKQINNYQKSNNKKINEEKINVIKEYLLEIIKGAYNA